MDKEEGLDGQFIATTELIFQNQEKEKRAAELVFSNKERERYASELINVNKKLSFQIIEKAKRATELAIANKKLIFQNGRKRERAAELVTANIELVFQNGEKKKRATELSISNDKLIKAEEKIRNLNRLYSFIHHTNKTTVHAKDEQTLFNDACSIAVNKGQFRMAWIGIADTATRRIKLVASSGKSEGDISILSDYAYISEGPIEKALSGSEYVVIPDLQKESAAPWNSHANERGFKSSICLPIKRSGKTIGVFTLFSSDTDFFDTEEVKMLIEASTDISFAVTLFEEHKQNKIVQQKLEQSEARLKEAQALGHIGNWEIDLIANRNMWSDEFYTIFGINREGVTPSIKSFLALLHPDDVSHAKDRITQTFQNNKAGSFHSRFIKKDTGIKHIYTEWKFEFDKNKKPVRVYGILQDITESKQAEEALRQSESDLQVIFENTSEGFILADTNGIIKAFNTKTAQTILLNTEQEIKIGSHIYDFIDPTRKESHKGVLSKVLAGKAIQYDHCIETKNGDIKWLIFSVNPAYNKSGEIEGVCITIADITEQKTTENNLSNTSVELQNTVSELHKILDSSLDVICTINTDGEFVNVSAASQQVWGYTPEELIGKKSMSLVYEEDLNITSKEAENFFGGIQIPTFENRYVHKSGRVVQMLWSVNWDEKLQLMVCIAKDVTEKKRLEKALESERDQFFDMFLKAPSAIGMVKGVNHVFEMANPLYLQLIGKKDVIGKTVLEVLPELVEQGFIGILDNVYRTGESYSGTEMLVQVDKEENGELTDFYMNFIYQAYRNGEGEIEGIFFFINDITEQVASRKNTEKSEKFFKGVIENSDDMIAIINASRKTMYASPAVSKKFGYTNQEFLSLGIADIVHPDDVLIIQEFSMKVRMNPGVPLEFPLIRTRKKDGTYIWVEGTLTNFLETEGINAIVANFRDITERKLADEQNRFKANLLNTIGQAAIATDMNGVVNYWNKAAENIYGWTTEEAIGKNIIHLTPSHSTKEQALEIMDELKNGRVWSGEFRVHGKDGTDFPVFITDSPIFDGNNKLSGIIGISSDITEKKKMEALLEKTNRLALIGSWEIDVDKGTVYWSDITKEIREADPDFIPDLSTGIGFFTEGENKKIISQRVQQCIEKGTPWDEELQLTTFKGNLKWVRTIGEAEFVQGKCSKVYGSFQDISVRKLAEQSLQRSRSNLKAIIENTEASIYSLDSELRFIAFNKLLHDNAQQIYGIDIKIGDPVLSFLEKLEIEEAKNWKEKYSKALKGETIKFEQEIAIDESHQYMSFSINPIWENKIIVGLSCFAYNITPQKQEERQKEKMSADIFQRNLDLEQFTFIVSHNLRSPAANIIACAEILQDETITPQEQKELLQGLSLSVNALDGVIKDINQILQVKSEVNQEKEVIIFSKLVGDIVISIRDLIDKNGVHIISDFSEVDEIYSLKVYLYSIFYNLIINSIKYSKPNEASRIEIKSKKENGKIILTFKDNGLGIDMKTYGDKIFGLYKRFHSHVEGKGMGLYMVKTQVESLGGKITIASELNEGTEFTIVFDT